MCAQSVLGLGLIREGGMNQYHGLGRSTPSKLLILEMGYNDILVDSHAEHLFASTWTDLLDPAIVEIVVILMQSTYLGVDGKLVQQFAKGSWKTLTIAIEFVGIGCCNSSPES